MTGPTLRDSSFAGMSLKVVRSGQVSFYRLHVSNVMKRFYRLLVSNVMKCLKVIDLTVKSFYKGLKD